MSDLQLGSLAASWGEGYSALRRKKETIDNGGQLAILSHFLTVSLIFMCGKLSCLPGLAGDYLSKAIWV